MDLPEKRRRSDLTIYFQETDISINRWQKIQVLDFDILPWPFYPDVYGG